MYIPEKRKNHQISFFDFNQSCGMQLDQNDRWIRMADHLIPWDKMENRYAELFPSKTGRPAIPFRMALAAYIIQKKTGLSDRRLIEEIKHNPYYQYFLGLERFSKEAPLKPAVLVSIRKRLTAEYLIEINNLLLEEAGSTPAHDEGKESAAAIDANTASEGIDNLGTAIIDATCSPSNIKYPQDTALLSEAREKLEEMIDVMHGLYHPWKKRRTYRKIARKEALAVAKAKKLSAKAIRAFIRKHLGYVLRDIKYLEEYMEQGYALPRKYVDYYLTILQLYEQQKYMFDHKVHKVANRIVSIHQPYIRPIVRGKAKAPTEFGAKYDVSIDEKGHARIEKISFDPYNESTIFQDVLNKYKERTGHYPKRALVDQIYRTRDNRKFCKDNNIEMSGPKLGRPAKDVESTKKEYQDNTDRIEVERFFSLEKRCCGAGLIMTKLKETSLASIAMSVFVCNLFSVKLPIFFVLYFMDANPDEFGFYGIKFEEN